MSVFHYMKIAISLNIFRLSYGFSNKEIDMIENHPVIKSRTLSYEIGRYSFNLIYWLLNLKGHIISRRKTCSKIIAFVATGNQYNAIKPVMQELEEGCMVGPDIEKPDVKSYHLLSAYLLSALYLPILVYRYTQATEYQRRSIRKCFHNYLLTYGYFVVACKRLQEADPSLLLISNDHVFWTCGMAKAAQELDIPVAYMQHASVTSDFPPLTYDYAFLNGRDALEKYREAGISSDTTVFLTGIPKFDKYADNVNTASLVQSLGVCTNRLDSIELVRDAARELSTKNEELDIFLRPHPADERRRSWIKLAKENGFGFSDSRKEESFQFLSRVDAIIAGASGIHLEACLMNVTPVFFDFGNIGSDRYGFVERGLAKEARNTRELVSIVKELVREKPDIRIKAKPFCESIDTDYDGRSRILVSKIVRDIINNGIMESIDNGINCYRVND